MYQPLRIHADLDGAILPVPDEINAPESDPYSNGIIHTAGLIAARDNNGIDIVGAAPEAKLLSLHAESLGDFEKNIRWAAGVMFPNLGIRANKKAMAKYTKDLFSSMNQGNSHWMSLVACSRDPLFQFNEMIPTINRKQAPAMF